MGCCFDCFRTRQNRRLHRPHLIPDSSPSSIREEVADKIRLTSMFTGEEIEEFVVEDIENLAQLENWSDIDEELLEEAKFLKACGTLPETPAEIRKAFDVAEKLEESDIKRPQSALKSSPETPEEVRKVESLDENSEKSNLRRLFSVLKSSPYPTPRKITDDMQTPGTVFATNMKSISKGNARIRSQYVYTVSNPIENFYEQQDLKQDNSISKANIGDDGDCNNLQEETSHISPKGLDVNGIPNSTNKHKDEKVHRHATPFEKRLENALSEDIFVPVERKAITGMPVVMEEMEGHDTVISQGQ